MSSAAHSHLLADVEQIMADKGAAVEFYESAGEFPREQFELLLKAGLVDLIVRSTDDEPRVHMFVDAIATIARHWLSLAESVHLQALNTRTVNVFAPPDLSSRLLPDMVEGRIIVSNCVSEEQAGSDIAGIALSARRVDENYVLTGRKTWVGLGSLADYLIVYARTSAAGIGGITCFLVDSTTPGLRIGAPIAKPCAGALPSVDIDFDSVSVPATSMLGRLNRGARVADTMLVQGRIGIAAAAVGLAEGLLATALEYAKTRVQFDRPIIRHQGIGFPLADMATQIEAARQLLYRACSEAETEGPKAPLLAAQAKLFATDTAMGVASEAVEILGAAAYRPDCSVERRMREAKLLQIIQGTNNIQRLNIAGRL